MKALPKKKKVAKLEREDEFLEEYSLKGEKRFFDKTEKKLKRMLKPKSVRKKRPRTKR